MDIPSECVLKICEHLSEKHLAIFACTHRDIQKLTKQEMHRRSNLAIIASGPSPNSKQALYEALKILHIQNQVFGYQHHFV